MIIAESAPSYQVKIHCTTEHTHTVPIILMDVVIGTIVSSELVVGH